MILLDVICNHLRIKLTGVCFLEPIRLNLNDRMMNPSCCLSAQFPFLLLVFGSDKLKIEHLQ